MSELAESVLLLPTAAPKTPAGSLDDLSWPALGSLPPKSGSSSGGKGSLKNTPQKPAEVSDKPLGLNEALSSSASVASHELPLLSPISPIDILYQNPLAASVTAANDRSANKIEEAVAAKEASKDRFRAFRAAFPASGTSDTASRTSGGDLGSVGDLPKTPPVFSKPFLEKPKIAPDDPETYHDGSKISKRFTRLALDPSRAAKSVVSGNADLASRVLPGNPASFRPATKPPVSFSVPSKPALGKIPPERSQWVPKEPYVPSAGLAFLPSQHQEHCRRTGGSFCIMVAGAAGTGKSTFLDTLFHTTLNPPEDDQKDVRVNRYLLVEDGFPLKLTCVDTPDYGITLDNHLAWLPLTRFLDEQFRSYVFQSEQPDRSARVDLRVHVCLYFLSPSEGALTPLDIESMRELSKRVNFIPVIGKCDALNKDEVDDLKKSIRDTLQREEIQICRLIADTALAKKINDTAPFAVMGSNAIFENTAGKKVRGRKYRWGLAEVENEEHCDFLALRLVLVEDHMLDLIASTEAHYDLFRLECLAARAKLVPAAESSESKEELHGVFEGIGYAQFLRYHKIPFQSVEYLPEDDPLLMFKKMEFKKAFLKKVQSQEQRFHEWKRALVEKQDELNEDLAQFEKRLVQLQEETNTFFDTQSLTQELHTSSVSDEESEFEYFATTGRDTRLYRRPVSSSLSEVASFAAL